MLCKYFLLNKYSHVPLHKYIKKKNRYEKKKLSMVDKENKRFPL